MAVQRGRSERRGEAFALAMDLGERNNPSSASDFRASRGYVEPLSDARTKLADIFSILPGIFI